MGKLFVVLFALAVLTGCAGRAGVVAEKGVAEGRAFEDAKAIAAVNAGCAAGIGALQRNFSNDVQQNLWNTCAALNSTDVGQFPGEAE